MDNLEGTHRAIVAALLQGEHFRFTLQGTNYTAIAKVKGKEHEFICIENTKKWVKIAFVVVVVAPLQSDVCMTNILPTTQVEAVSGRVSCDTLAEMVFASAKMIIASGNSRRMDPNREPSGSQMVAALSERNGQYFSAFARDLADLILATACRLGVFAGTETYRDLMAAGTMLPQELQRHDGMLRAARNDCRPDELESMMLYAAMVISHTAVVRIGEEMRDKLSKGR